MTATRSHNAPPRVVIIGAGPAGLMAAQTLAAGGAQVAVYDAMPSVGRKFLLAGVGGMNITHSEALPAFLDKYGARRPALQPLIDAFPPEALRGWIHSLGIETFVGTSGRVFPREMKAAPLLRAWLQQLRLAGVAIHVRQRWLGWAQDGALRMASADGEQSVHADAVVLALGGASWSRLGSDGAWVPLLQARSVPITPLQPANCGFDVAWRAPFIEKFAGHPLKTVALAYSDAAGLRHYKHGECVVTQHGVEGSLIYAFSSALREQINNQGSARIEIDLLPGRSLERVLGEVGAPRGSKSLSSHLHSKVGLAGVKTGLLWEVLSKEQMQDMPLVARSIKALPLTLTAPRPLDEAISTAGGVPFEALDSGLMLKAAPGVFCAGEMLDWEAPTGGYLLTACFATGLAAGRGALAYLAKR